MRLTTTIKLLAVAIALMSAIGIADAQVPTCVTALKAVPPGPFPCSVSLTWTDNNKPGDPNNETAFEIQRGLNGSAFADWGKQAVDTPTWTDSTLTQSMTAANTYAYRVRSVNSAGASGWSTEATYVIPQGIPPVLPPTTPTSLTIGFVNGTGELKIGNRHFKFDAQDGNIEISDASSIIVLVP